MKCEDVKMPFGKYKGVPLGQILIDNPAYIDWLVGRDWLKGEIKKAADEMAKKYEAQIEQAIN